jgi:hypothetical protein
VQRRALLSLILVAACLAWPVSAANRRAHVEQSESFDWDDNIMAMATRVWLKAKHGGSERSISTAEYALVRNTIGKSGEFAHHYIDRTPATGTFREFADHGYNEFERDIKLSLARPGWRGPMWDEFVHALARESTAKRVSIITAREHEAGSILRGLRYLRRKGLIRYLPSRKNIFAVGPLGWRLRGVEIPGPNAARKVAVMRALLDDLDRKPGGPRTWTFSDDDFENFEAARHELATDVRAGRWKNVRIELAFTGTNHPTEKPRTITLR